MAKKTNLIGYLVEISLEKVASVSHSSDKKPPQKEGCKKFPIS